MTASTPATADRTLYACPACHGDLSSELSNLPGDSPQDSGVASPSFVCSACQRVFPLIRGCIPILLPSSEDYLSGERQVLQHTAAQHQATSDYYRQVAETTEVRRTTLRELATGLSRNGQLLRELAEELPLSDAAIEEHPIALGGDLFAALRKDWSGTEESEAEVQVATRAIVAALSEAPPRRTLLLGAGVGRTLCEIDAVFPGAVGVDLSAAMALAFLRMCERSSLSAYMLHQGNFLRGDDECEPIVARRELAAGSPQFAIADARQLPFADGCFDAIVSNYFTDMVPLSMWLPEAGRVLSPGGRLIHFGPLGYAFPHIDEHYAVDQLPAAFQQFGFEISPPRIVPSTFYGSVKRLNRFHMDNLFFTARRTLP